MDLATPQTHRQGVALAVFGAHESLDGGLRPGAKLSPCHNGARPSLKGGND
ncbi:uncharacterized protein PHALS_13262 [Plasmopara halstedii]|uniref:Uncharacterized protein n=1 Tax=Plasmopara halstedii TaxID=4781 RepID=A0A0P1AQ77_PLAHL|nr:uncharacterized protein PHALS_13262 [Plasmopara halstedii]CEG43037.1 hypothetical protein PHALS_13262 [Plasmopara halstedii]|eukprot:XP_024579406.1 hypothetical protein PHALS_13262 [Plasmopara halstedii]